MYNENMGIGEDTYNKIHNKQGWFGNIKERHTLTLEILTYSGVVNDFGYFMHYLMKDIKTGNLFFYKGSVDLGLPEQIITINATIKGHTIHNYEKCTLLARPKKGMV